MSLLDATLQGPQKPSTSCDYSFNYSAVTFPVSTRVFPVFSLLNNLSNHLNCFIFELRGIKGAEINIFLVCK